MPSPSKQRKAKSKTSTGALKASWTATPIPTPQAYINSVAISQDGSTVVAGTFYFPYAAGAKHSSADAAPITVGTFAWNANGKSLWQDKFQATEGVYGVAVSRDGTWAAAAGLSAPGQGFVDIYKIASGTRVTTYNPKGFSRNGSTGERKSCRVPGGFYRF
jgi:hypothetical protein